MDKNMENNEQHIRNMMGNNNPFTVPEGYFDQMTDQLMSRLPEKKQPTLIKRLRPLLYAAVFAGIAVFSMSLFLNREDKSQETAIASMSSDLEFEDVADYAMVDNQDIYAYLLADM